MRRRRTAVTTTPVEQVPQFQARHSYGGDNPTVLRLLDSVFTEGYPTDIVEMGPYVKEVDVRRPIKRAGGLDGNKMWRPEGNLVAIFGEHTGPINRVVMAPDHAFFVTASDDGSVKVWDSMKLEKNLTRRSRQTHRHAPGARVKSLTFVENTYTFISGATDGSIHAVRVDYQNDGGGGVRYGKLQVLRDYQLPTTTTTTTTIDGGTVEYAVWMEHFRADNQSTLLMATNTSRILALELRSMQVIFALQNPVHHGTPTTFCCDRKHQWMVMGTTHGVADLWDLRFRVRLKAWGVRGISSIHRLQMHPTRGRGRWVFVSGSGSHGNEISVWDIEKVQCREVYRANSSSTERVEDYTAWLVDGDRAEGMLSRFATSTSISSSTGVGICGLAVGFDAPEQGAGGGGGGRDVNKGGFVISAGGDETIRFWDLSRPEQSTIVSGGGGGGGGGNKARYEVKQASTTLVITSEHLIHETQQHNSRRGGSRTMVQPLLKRHLDLIQDIALLREPYGMTVSVDRAGMVYVFQ